jgi:hypothetical protein
VNGGIMNLKIKNRLKRALQEELIKRLLIKYFDDKGAKESLVYPPMVYDLPGRVPELLQSVEIVPFAESIDPVTNIVKVGWNLFVLGTNRMSLGTSTHTNFMELQRSILGGTQNTSMPSERKKTPKQIVEFVMNVIGRNKDAILEIPPGARMPAISQFLPLDANKMKIGPTMSGGFYEKNRPVG